MLNAEIIKRDKPEMDDANISAFIRLARNFDCLDCESYAEAHAKILNVHGGHFKRNGNNR